MATGSNNSTKDGSESLQRKSEQMEAVFLGTWPTVVSSFTTALLTRGKRVLSSAGWSSHSYKAVPLPQQHSICLERAVYKSDHTQNEEPAMSSILATTS